MMRTFIAIELDETVRAALIRLEARLAQAAPSLRWTDAAKLHLTLAFLGELDDEQVRAATAAAQSAATHTQAFRVALAEPGYFGSRRSPRVIWAGVGGDTRSLLAAQARLADELAARGFPREERPFAPHLTLARVQRPLAPEEMERLLAAMDQTASGGAADRAAMTASGMTVMKSDLSREGARYTPLAHCAFQPA